MPRIVNRHASILAAFVPYAFTVRLSSPDGQIEASVWKPIWQACTARAGADAFGLKSSFQIAPQENSFFLNGAFVTSQASEYTVFCSPLAEMHRRDQRPPRRPVCSNTPRTHKRTQHTLRA